MVVRKKQFFFLFWIQIVHTVFYVKAADSDSSKRKKKVKKKHSLFGTIQIGK